MVDSGRRAAGVSLQKKMTIGMIVRFTAGLEMEHGRGEDAEHSKYMDVDNWVITKL